MKFLLKSAFWLTIVLILLPTGGSKDSQTSPEQQISASEAVSAASAAVSDMKGFCARQPDACSVGSQVAVALGHKAQAGAKMLYEFLNDKMAAREHSGAAAKGAASQHTLTPADLTPAWRAPAPRKDADSRV
jgi:microcystin degradation protein MlrC